MIGKEEGEGRGVVVVLITWGETEPCESPP